MVNITKLLVCVLIILFSILANNASNHEPSWDQIELLGIDTNLSYAHPILMKYSNPSSYDIFYGQNSGAVIHQSNIAASTTRFVFEESEIGLSSDLYNRSAPYGFDINSDGNTDILIGDEAGNIHLYLQFDGRFEKDTSTFADIKVDSFSKVTMATIDDDEFFDIVVGTGRGE
ncbi:MAG: VCBS repeat-containing protein, partial [Candidatus Heimdallarchaeota archaeon]|nr:VCBS repeat-containing protein [Candidatus Heimdallarchaeota archaeon]